MAARAESLESDNTSRFFIDFNDELNEMWERMEADPRIADAEAGIISCVNDRGFDYTGMSDFEDELNTEVQQLESTIDYSAFEVPEEQVELSDEELAATFNQIPPLPDESRAQLAELQEREVAVAVAVLECGGGWEAQDELYREVAADYEQEFLEENADRLEDYRG